MAEIRSSNPSVSILNGLKTPATPEDLLRIFPQLLSSLQTIQNRLNELERRVRGMETISGEGNQV